MNSDPSVKYKCDNYPECMICNWDEYTSAPPSDTEIIIHQNDIALQFMSEFKATIAGLATNPMVQAFLPPHVKEQLRVAK